MTLARHSFTVQDSAGNLAGQVLLEVRSEEVGLPLAAIYSDRDGLEALDNPVLLSQDGSGISFHVAGGAYSIQVTTDEGVALRRYVAVGTAQEEDWPEFGALALGNEAADVPFTPIGNLAATDVQAALEELDDEKEPADATILKEANVEDSVTISGGGNLQLVNDEASPGALQFYGTDGSGTKGWQGPPAPVNLLASGAVSNQAALEISLAAFTAYRRIEIVLQSFLPATDDAELWARFSSDGGANYDATGYNYAGIGIRDQGTSANISSGSANQILLNSAASGQGVSNVAAEGGLDGRFVLMGRTTARWTRLLWHAGWTNTVPEGQSVFAQGSRETGQDTDAIQFRFDSGNIASGSYAVYGYM